MSHYPSYPPYQLPGGVDPDALIKFMEYWKTTAPKPAGIKSGKSEVKDFLRLWSAFKEADEKKKKEDEEVKKKADEEKKKKEATVQALPTFTLAQVFMLLLTFGLPVGAAWLSVMEASFQVVKRIIIP